MDEKTLREIIRSEIKDYLNGWRKEVREIIREEKTR